MDDTEEVPRGLTDALPPWLRDFLDEGGWWVIAGLAVLMLLAVLWWLVERFRARRRRALPDDPECALTEDLDQCPQPAGAPGPTRLTVYHVPVRLRLVVVAPAGQGANVDRKAVRKLLDRVLPGLGEVVADDRPRVRVWPPQLSQQGFASVFHRHTPRHEQAGQPSRWVLVAGRVQVGRQPLLLGLGLWADQPTTLGRLTLEPHQWLDVLRLRTAEE